MAYFITAFNFKVFIIFQTEEYTVIIDNGQSAMTEIICATQHCNLLKPARRPFVIVIQKEGYLSPVANL